MMTRGDRIYRAEKDLRATLKTFFPSLEIFEVDRLMDDIVEYIEAKIEYENILADGY